jgi:hypothetical protein
MVLRGGDGSGQLQGIGGAQRVDLLGRTSSADPT